MLAITVLLATGAVLASASPLTLRQASQDPPQSTSQGFRLVANYSSAYARTSPSISGWYLEGIHVGAGLNNAILQPYNASQPAPIFYVNGTSNGCEPSGDGQMTTLVTDAANFPESVIIQNATAANASAQIRPDPDLGIQPGDGAGSIAINAGDGGTYAAISCFPNPLALLANLEGTGTFVACARLVPYYERYFVVVEYAYDTDTDAVIPDECVPIDLLPECATLPALPAGSLGSHAFAQTVGCYQNVSAIDWSKY